MRVLFLIGVLAVASISSGCATGQFIENARMAMISQEALQEYGREKHQELKKANALYEKEDLTDYINKVGQRVAESDTDTDLLYRFHLLDDPDLNAYSVPGGYIYLTRGMVAMLENEDELAALIGHEIAHISKDHTTQQVRRAGRMGMVSSGASLGMQVIGVVTFNPILIGLSGGAGAVGKMGTQFISSDFGRAQEFEADIEGLRYAAEAGYNPKSAIRVAKLLQDIDDWNADRADYRGEEKPKTHGVFATHPENEDRIEKLTEEAKKFEYKKRKPEGDFLARIDGTAYGLSSKVGVHRGRKFYSKTHDVVIRIPRGWFVEQAPDYEAAVFGAPEGAAYISLLSRDLARKMDAKGFAEFFFESTNLEGETKERKGRKIWRGSIGSGDAYEAATWVDGDKGYALIGSADEKFKGKARVDDLPKQFDKMLRTMRPLKKTEQKLASSIELNIMKTKVKTTYKKMARKTPLGADAESTLRLLNGDYQGGEPKKGQRVKTLR